MRRGTVWFRGKFEPKLCLSPTPFCCLFTLSLPPFLQPPPPSPRPPHHQPTTLIFCILLFLFLALSHSPVGNGTAQLAEAFPTSSFRQHTGKQPFCI
ncbi:hypothetical protein M0802_012960 [Mischocyttarus mexicanus]|nr:hypothetical protein M0802_012963 [Mischocyttarus mexicanus]KAI4484914.1 hypothetical protein M0802_012960 [Mischocyttarus mexicanus]